MVTTLHNNPAPRADFILASAIALVSILVLALAIALRAEPAAHQRTLTTIAAARGVRDHTLALAQASAEAQAAHREIQSGRASRRALETAETQIAYNIAALRDIAGEDRELNERVTRLETIINDSVAVGPVESLSQLRVATGELIGAVNRRNDAARAGENRLRDRLDTISIALAALSLIASGLAMFALRREREQWRLAHALADDARARAAESDAMKTRFLTAASHDMRQPLHALTLYLSALDRRVQGEEARDILLKADSAAQSLAGMFGVLLDLARIEANAVVPNFESVSVQEIFERAASGHPGADIETEPTRLAVRSDAVLLERIVRNLTSNALKHGGGRVRLSAHSADGTVEIRVTDDGPGIAPADQERIFGEFVRLDGRAAPEGLGLGLSIVRRLAGLLGHDVSVRSTPGDGATFIVRAAAATRVDAPADQRALASNLKGADVLVLDDDPLALNAAVHALTDLGANVRACADQAQLEHMLAQGWRPRFAVLDLRINGEIAGLAIADALRQRLSPPPRVVIMTADTATDMLATLRTSGHNWLVKPVDAAALAAALS